MKALILIFNIFLIVLIIPVVGSLCLAYDCNHIAGAFKAGYHYPLPVYGGVSLLIGFLLSETVIPIAIVVWILIQVGILQ